MTKQLLTILLFFMFGISELILCQPLAKNQDIKKIRSISIFPLRIFAGEIVLNYEHAITNKYSVGIQGGYINSFGDIGIENVPLGSPRFVHNGFVFGLFGRKYTNLTKRKFLEIGFRYRNKYGDNIRFSNDDSTPTYQKHIYFNQILQVINPYLIGGVQKNPGHFIFEFYYGGGFNLTYVKTEYLGCSTDSTSGPQDYCNETIGINDSDKPDYDNGWYIVPTIHIGIKIGAGFY